MTRNLGPGPFHRSETASAAAPVAASPGRHFGARSYVRPLAGLATIIVIAFVVAVAIGLFRGDFTTSVPVTVVSPRAGLVMNPDAYVKMRGVEVGKVASIDVRPNGQAVLHLAMQPSQMHLIPAQCAMFELQVGGVELSYLTTYIENMTVTEFSDAAMSAAQQILIQIEHRDLEEVA